VSAATVAAIFWVALWHVIARLPLLPASPPAVFVFGITWAFTGWVWPGDTPPPHDGIFLTGARA
jgi:hypothetical protein